jgi:dTDP-4-dehydrorhamnose reductase
VSDILVIGRNGQLAQSLSERAAERGLKLAFAARPQVDLAQPDTLRRAVAQSGAGIVINAAAHTAVDRAEDEPELAHALNAVAPGVLAETARACGARLIHLSTDYVFDGSGDRPWAETDPTNPRSVYGRTKLQGEDAVRTALPDHLILRTAWVYSPFGGNFVKTMLKVAETRERLTVVADQIGNPTSALDIADGILAAIASWSDNPSLGIGGTFHLAGTGSTSWAGFAREIFAQSSARGGPAAEVADIATADWPAKAPRPLNSRLCSDRFERTFGYRAPRWQESLAAVLGRLLPRP